jgi:ABC-type uncharacterized transport system involved in gliding motility auxiliary subunit
MKEQLASWNRILALIGGSLLLAGLTILLIQRKATLPGEILLGIGLVLLLAAWLVNPAAPREALGRRGTRYGGNLALMSLILLGIVALINVLSYRHYAHWDLTQDRLFTLSSKTRQILDQISQPVKITGFFYREQRSEELRALDLLESYRAYTDQVSYHIVDPDVRISLAEQYDIRGADYTIVIESGEQRQDISVIDEQAITSAIFKVTQERLVRVYFIGGHEERQIQDQEGDGYSGIVDLLEQAGYEVETLSLATAADPLPIENAVLVLAGPRFVLPERELQLLADHLRNGGKLLCLLDPVYSPDLSELLLPWGVWVKDSLIVDPSNALAGMDPTIPVHQYAKTDHPITRKVPATFFPGVRPVGMIDAKPAGLTITPLLGTSESSWAESNPDVQPMAFDAQEDEQGPLFLAIAVQGRPDEGQQFATRMVVVGDSDFVANAYRGNNDFFFLNTINWLAEEEALTEISPAELPNRGVYLTATQQRAINYLTLGGIPLVITATGVGIWLHRRKR